MTIALDTVVKQLTDSGIIAPGKLENFIPPKASPKDGEALLRELHKQKLLTTFQTQQVAANKTKSLILGNYTLIDRIGAGGMGQVFKAEHRRLKRVVAIKMLPKAMLKDATAVARFQREVEAAAKLRHTNIVATDDADEANGVHFLVMEYIEGQDLSVLVKKNGPFPVGKAVNYILQAARGLEFAHSKGVIHRDIKPANLLLGNDGVVKILDMGLARIDSDGPAQTELTGSGTIMGTVDYMSPEQALNTKHADHRADIYSLGISLYYLLAGKSAYGGETAMEKLMAHSTQPIPSLQDVQTTVPKGLDAVFKKMVAKKMEDRYQSMGEVIEALEDLGIGGSATVRKGEVASTVALSPEQKKMLASQAKKKPRGSITEVVASEKTKHLFLKIIGGSFATIIAPILVAFLIRYVEKKDEPAKPPAANAPANVPPVEVATNTTSQPIAHVVDDGSPKPLVAPFDAKQAHAGQAAWAKHLGRSVEQKNPVGMTMVLIPPGEFLMGSTDEQVAAALKAAEEIKASQTEKDRIQKAERPQHQVVINKPFLMSATEVTIGQFRKFVETSKYVTEAEQYGFGDSAEKVLSDKVPAKSRGLNWKSPGYVVTDDSPVAQVTWNDACAYCAWVSEQEQRSPWYRPDGKGGWLIAAHANGYRLPTEAEWEHACRAGTTTQNSFGDDYAELEQFGWFNKNAGGMTKPVALKLPNPFGLFDIHGNLYEWCQDFYDEKWYEKPQSNDPKGPSSGSLRVLRGGSWYNSASLCRSAYRNSYTPSSRSNAIGFRGVRVADAASESRLATGTATVQPNQPWNTPAFQAWMKEVQAMPAEKQIEAVSKKLIESNPGFDGNVTGHDGNGIPVIEGGMVTELGFVTDSVRDISPVRALAGLKTLSCRGSGVGKGKLSDLSPLQGMPLTILNCAGTRVSDLSPLEGMKLTGLTCNGTPVSDLTPVKGMPLWKLYCYSTPVSDLSLLQGMNLNGIRFTPTNITKGMDVIRQMKTLNTIGTDGTNKFPPEEFWKKYDAGEFGTPAVTTQPNKPWNTPAFQAWMKEVQALPAEKQVEAVSKKLMELNPGFDGKLYDQSERANSTARIENGVVTELGVITDNLTDISPVQALAGLKWLNCSGSGNGKGKLSDLSPLQGMPLTILSFNNTRVSDISALREMKLITLQCKETQVFDLKPLAGMPLTFINCYATPVADLSPLRAIPLTFLDCSYTKVTDLTPLKGMKLAELRCHSSQISDLSPLQGLPLTTLNCNGTRVSDLSALAGMPLTALGCSYTPVSNLSPLTTVTTLRDLRVTKTKVTAAGVAALQKALPNCKIEWDDPAKPKTPEPAAAGTK